MAALLSDQIDRLNLRTRSLKSIASQTAQHNATTRTSRPFTHAVLEAEIGELIRDIDAPELGLFALQKRTYDSELQEAQLKRVDFVGATPLRKNPARRDENAPELAPEKYAEGALRCLARYHVTRPMPETVKHLSDILRQLEASRKLIAALEATLKAQQKDLPQAEPPLAGKSSLKAEEESIQQLHSRLEELNARKKQLQARNAAKPIPAKPTKVALPASPEDKFWAATPGEVSKSFKFSTNLLVHEEVDFNGLDDASFSMPTPQKDVISGGTTSLNFTEAEPLPEEPVSVPAQEMPPPIEVPEEIKRAPQTPPRDILVPEEEPVRPTPSSAKRDSVRVNAEVERITSKISAVYGDLLALAQEGSKKTGTAKGVVACLRNISSQTPSLDSPSVSSISTANPQTPSAQEILTAYLLTQLLTAPGHTIPLNKLKDALSTKCKTGGMTVGALGQNPTRILYGCVGKRVVKIDRSGGEQLVKFDC